MRPIFLLPRAALLLALPTGAGRVRADDADETATPAGLAFALESELAFTVGETSPLAASALRSRNTRSTPDVWISSWRTPFIATGSFRRATERSREFPEQPTWQSGVALRYVAHPHAEFGIDFLKAEGLGDSDERMRAG